MGKLAPDPAHNITLDGDVVVPAGKIKDTEIVNPQGYTLQYNEYIVCKSFVLAVSVESQSYSSRLTSDRRSQVKFRYLLKCKFNY